MTRAMSIRTTLRKAAQLQDKIEQLRGELTALLTQARAEVEHTPVVLPAAAGMYSRRPPKHKRARARVLSPRREGIRGAGGFGALSPPSSRPVRRRRGPSPRTGKKRNASPSGPLAPAVVKVLAAKGEPMQVRDILEGLKLANYQFTSTEPKKNLAARIYRLKGVRQVGEGLFAAGQ